MRSITPNLILLILLCFTAESQNRPDEEKSRLLSRADYDYLEGLTRDVLESSRIYPGQSVSPDFGPNNTGGTLIRPGGRDCYPSFWIRDYAMALECDFITGEEQKHMLLLTASTQCNQTLITKGGSMIPAGAIADHIRIDDSMPVYFPGTYSYIEQGNKIFGMFPPYDDQFYFIHMAYFYVKSTGDYPFLWSQLEGMTLIDRLELAFKEPPERMDNHIVQTTADYRGVDFGFRDAIEITGDLCFSSILKFRASNELAEIFQMIHNDERAKNYRAIAEEIRHAVPALFLDHRGMLLASTGKSKQPDVWGTALAIYWNVLEGEDYDRACRVLADAYKSGFLAYKGNIRHILTCDDYNDSTAWEVSLAKKNTYQNGAYWGTPTGWVCYAIANADFNLARKLAGEYIADLRDNDYRKGKEWGAPFECFHPSGNRQNPVYLATVACPFIVFGSLNRNSTHGNK